MTVSVLSHLSQLIEHRKSESSEHSYVASLLDAGEDKILRKLMEECTEVLLASKQNSKEEVIKEMADLWFHSLVLLGHHHLTVEDVCQELTRREGLSGLTEKAMRQK